MNTSVYFVTESVLLKFHYSSIIYKIHNKVSHTCHYMQIKIQHIINTEAFLVPLLVISCTKFNHYSVDIDLFYLLLNVTNIMDGIIYEHLQLTSWLYIMTWRLIHVLAYNCTSLFESAYCTILWTYQFIFYPF